MRIRLSLIGLVCLAVGCGGIHRAVKYNDLNSVRSYVNRGDIDKRDERYGLTPLMLAAYYDYPDIAKYLLEQGASVNMRDKSGRTALIYAASYNYLDMARLLLEHKASTLVEDNDGYNASDYAEAYEFTEMVELLNRYPQNAYIDKRTRRHKIKQLRKEIKRLKKKKMKKKQSW